jgi:hypothetical protein
MLRMHLCGITLAKQACAGLLLLFRKDDACTLADLELAHRRHELAKVFRYVFRSPLGWRPMAKRVQLLVT